MHCPVLACTLVAGPGAGTVRELLARQLALRGAVADQGPAIHLALDPALGPGGLRLAPGILAGGDLAGLIAAVGCWLRAIDWSAPALPALACERRPALELRMQQVPGHFGNSFECMGRREMRTYLEDLALAGSNGYADRFDQGEVASPFRHHAFRQEVNLGQGAELWAKKAGHLKDASALGLRTCVTLNPNHVYLDQWRPELDATPGKGMIGNLICPSAPGARELIVGNYADLWAWLAESGVRLDSIRPAPYDDGGCACPRCTPWLATFLGLAEAIGEAGRRHWPGLEGFISGWWMSDDDLALLRRWREGRGATWISTLLYNTGYQNLAMPDLAGRLAPLGYGCYVHAAYSGHHGDRYERNGTHCAARRLQAQFRQFPGRGVRRFMAYTEGVQSHLSSFLCARLGYDPDCDVAAEMAGWCRWFLGTDPAATARLVALLLDIEGLDGARAAGWRRELAALEPALRCLPGREYLWQQLVAKATLLDLDHRAQGPAGAAALDDLAEEYEAVYEHLQRKVWGTGVRRHVLTDRHYLPGWVQRWREQRSPELRPIPRRAAVGLMRAGED